jgi:predicted Zn-dependent protease
MRTLKVKKLVILLPVIALAACATPETKVRNSLMKAGLSAPMASCMADRMVDRLSLTQLRRLSSLSSLKEREVGAMTIDELIYRTRALQDPEILRVVTSSGLRCAIVN